MTDKNKATEQPLLQRSDLHYGYDWEASEGDNSRIVGFPDNVLLSRREGYEVLPFINRFAKKHELKNKISGKKIEWLVQEKLPSEIRSHAKVHDWIVKNWKTYNDEWDIKVKRGDIAS